MTTQVVNIRLEEYDVYIGRPGKGKTGYFGSPIIIGQICQECHQVHSSKGDTLPCYRKYFERRIKEDAVFRTNILALKDKRLGCFCVDKNRNGLCHGYIIKEWIDGN